MGNNSGQSNSILLVIAGAIILLLLGILGFFGTNLVGDVKQIRETTLPSIEQRITKTSDDLDNRISSNKKIIQALVSASITDKKLKKYSMIW